MSAETDTRQQAKADAAADKARAKAARPWYKKKRVIVPLAALLLLFVVIAANAGGDTDPELVDEDADGNEVAPEADEGSASDEADEAAAGDQADVEGEVADDTFSAGDTVAMGDLEHTLHTARFSQGDEFMQPDEGERWLVVDVEVTNNSDESQAMSSMMMWRLVDEDNRSRDITITPNQEGDMDGELGAGRSMRGEIAYTVPEGQTRWELIFEPEVFGFGQAIYELSEADMQ